MTAKKGAPVLRPICSYRLLIRAITSLIFSERLSSKGKVVHELRKPQFGQYSPKEYPGEGAPIVNFVGFKNLMYRGLAELDA